MIKVNPEKNNGVPTQVGTPFSFIGRNYELMLSWRWFALQFPIYDIIKLMKKSYAVSFLAFLALSLLLVKSADAAAYYIKVDLDKSGGGTGEVTFSATSSPDFEFSGWSGESCAGKGNCALRNLISGSPKKVVAGFNAPVCDDDKFTYTDFGTSCSLSGVQRRTITSASPPGCVGGNPILTKGCFYNVYDMCARAQTTVVEPTLWERFKDWFFGEPKEEPVEEPTSSLKPIPDVVPPIHPTPELLPIPEATSLYENEGGKYLLAPDGKVYFQPPGGGQYLTQPDEQERYSYTIPPEGGITKGEYSVSPEGQIIFKPEEGIKYVLPPRERNVEYSVSPEGKIYIRPEVKFAGDKAGSRGDFEELVITAPKPKEEIIPELEVIIRREAEPEIASRDEFKLDSNFGRDPGSYCK